MKYFTFLLLIALCLGCNTSNRKRVNLKKDEIPVNFNFEFKKNIFDLIKEIDLIEIKKKYSLNYVVGQIIKIINYNKDSIYCSTKNDEIYLINTNGELLNTLSSKGLGPNEYRELKDFDISKTGELYIYDFQKQRFLVFDSGFNYLRTENIGFNLISFKFVDDNIALFTGKHRNNINNSFFDYDLFIINKKFEIIKNGLPFNNEKFEKVRIHNNVVFHNLIGNNDSLLFNDLISDTIYVLSKNNIKVFKSFSYVDNTLESDYKLKSHEFIINDINKNIDKFKNFNFFANLKGINNKNIIYNFSHEGKESIYSFLSKESGKVVNYKFPVEFATQYHREIFEIKASESKKFISVIYPVVLEFIREEYIKHYSKDSDEFINRINNILKKSEPDGNQIIIKYEIK